MRDLGTAPQPDEAATESRRGRLELSFARAPDGRTYIDRQYASYPFHICRPFYLDSGAASGMASVYKQSCSGGLYTGDRLVADIEIRQDAQAHLTTQGSTIVHRGAHGRAGQTCTIRAHSGALAEYLPEATILFPGADLKASLRVILAEDASAILFDSFLAHDYRGGDDCFGTFENEVVIAAVDGTPLVTDRFRLTGAEYRSDALGQMAGHACHGSVMVVAPGADIDALLASGRAAAGTVPGAMTGLSALPGVTGISARILSRDAVPMKKVMLRLWMLARTAITGVAPGPRRK